MELTPEQKQRLSDLVIFYIGKSLGFAHQDVLDRDVYIELADECTKKLVKVCEE